MASSPYGIPNSAYHQTKVAAYFYGIYAHAIHQRHTENRKSSANCTGPGFNEPISVGDTHCGICTLLASQSVGEDGARKQTLG